MSYSLKYVSPTGREYEFLNGSDGEPFVEFDTLSGFVGVFEDTPVQSVGVPGAVVDFRDRVVQQMTGAFTLVVFSREQWEQARRDFSTREYGTLILDNDGLFELPVRLAESLPTPGHVPAVGSRLEVSMIADTGVWLSRASSTGIVNVTNWGDVPVWPEIVWKGNNQSVVLPSGVGFPLPYVMGTHRLPLDRRASGKAVGESTGKAIKTDAVGEMVPVGATREYRVTSGARVEWSVGVLDPWN
ncbi:hypothetical protein QP902_09895 [Corynebacterium marquesiae]|uniref:hypothetical protein n=1 Tax=Corynebacterium marquesiae TaxID=2913503 RepID=UPI00254D08CF|nr:hypothetical protein [Corynebacterium marquesiae]MDK8668982.1 hypothetical protein [Corynebacterium marquesiae]